MSDSAVVFIGMVYPWGGVRHLALLGAELAKCQAKYDFHFASCVRADPGFWDIVDSALPGERKIVANDFSSLTRQVVGLANAYRRVIVHTGGGWGQTREFLTARMALPRAKRERVEFVATTHSYRNESWLRIPVSIAQCGLYTLFYRKVIFQCQYALDRFWGGSLLRSLGKISIVPLGCELFSETSDNIPREIEQIGLADLLQNRRIFKFVYLAGFRPGKNHIWLVRAMESVLKAHSDVRLLMFGNPAGNVYGEVQRIVSELGLSGQVALPGKIPRSVIPWLLQHVDCAIVPSSSETFGHCFLEPMFAGIPVLGTNVGVAQDIIKEGETGFKFSLKSMSSLQNCVERVLSQKGLVKELGRRAKLSVECVYTHAAVARKLSAVYREILSA